MAFVNTVNGELPRPVAMAVESLDRNGTEMEAVLLNANQEYDGFFLEFDAYPGMIRFYLYWCFLCIYMYRPIVG